MNQLFFGDNLGVLRESIKDESVDLIYLDPPFNSSATYNVLFASPTGDQSHAQIEAFEDTWHWGEEAEKEFGEILTQPNTQVAEVMRSLRQFLGENDVMAYLTMMANRLLELRRVLKSTGSLYLHCDPTASHYLKVLLDSVFGPIFFRNEIIWRRTGSHNSSRRYGPIHDVILFYSKTNKYTWNALRRPYMQGHVDNAFVKEGNQYRTNYSGNVLTGSGRRTGESGHPWKGFDPDAKGRHWAIPSALLEGYEDEVEGLTQAQKMDFLYERGHITIKPTDEWPRYQRIITQKDGQKLSDIWAYQPYTEGTLFESDVGIDDDVRWMGTKDTERLGYPTQKPLGLMERIISSSSNEGDLVLDPFCGCGTTIHAAQKLNRRWIGIDITHLAISLIEKRLREAFPGILFDVHGTPKDIGGARNLAERDKYQFQWWACSLVNAQPYGGKKKGADGGVDGLIFFQDDKELPKKIIVSVKGGENVGVTMVKDLIATCARQKAEIGLFVTLNAPTKPMVTEAAAAGFYHSPAGKQFPKIQILTIEGLLTGTEAGRYPNLDAGGLTFKKAEIEYGLDTQDDLFLAPPRKKKKKT